MSRGYIGVIGYGYVGKAVVNFFKDHFRVFIYDPAYGNGFGKYENKSSDGYEIYKTVQFTEDIDQINSCDLVVICVPTPMSEDGSVDLSIIEETVQKFNAPLMLIKSTIPPGTTERLREETGKYIAFSPEFIGEGKYVVQWWKDKGYPHPTDMKYHDFQIFGGRRDITSGILQYFKKVLGPEAKYIQTDSTTAELCKYMENSWGAMKVTFCNEWFEIAKQFGVDYDELRELWLLDGRVERMHTAVFPESRGFGGKCYPKDVNGIIKAVKDKGYTPKLMDAVIEVNKDIQEEQAKYH